jgi:RecA/RadA recombinase
VRPSQIENISPDRAKREKATAEYGSFENMQAKGQLRQYEQKFFDDYHREFKAAESEDDMVEALGHRVPFWMSPFVLRGLDLALMGAPEGSDEWKQVKAPASTRMARKNPEMVAFYADYTAMGWPKTAGTPIRWVTPEEHREITARLKDGSLTLPGAEVATTGKTLAKMVEEGPGTPEWLIEGILRRGGAAMVYGPPGVGKTFLVHTLMLLVAAGRGAGVVNTLTGGWVLKAGDHNGAKVCLLDGEMIEADIVDRAKGLCEGLGLRMTGSVRSMPPMDLGRLRLALAAAGESPDDIEETICAMGVPQEPESVGFDVKDDGPTIDLSNIEVYAKAAQDHRAIFPDIVDQAWIHKIVSVCMAGKIDVLILDNLSTLTTTLEDENSAANWHPLNALVVALKNAGTATILVHHSNKAGTGYRGSSNLSTTLETVVKLEKLEGPRAKEGAGFKVTLEKNRAHGRPYVDGKSLVLRDSRWTIEEDPLGQAAKLVDMVNSMEYATQQELADDLGVNQATVSRAFIAAEELGLGAVKQLNKKLADARRLRARMAQAQPEEAEDEPEDSALDI